MSCAEDPGRLDDLAARIASGALTPRALVERCLARVAAVDASVQAWITVEAEAALAAADALGAEAAAGRRRGPLHGLPFAVKDVIDLAGLPTRAGSRARAGAPPAAMDATVVARLRAMGAIPLGKVHTTEFAFFDGVPPTRNPHDLTRTPGGSSAGAAAAVASGTAPFALGTQTAGSISRPAAFCGIGAFKPSTLGVVGWGVTPLAPSFDTVGAFAATAADAATVCRAMAPEGLGMARSDPPAETVLVLQDPLIDALASPEMLQAVAAFAERLAAAGLAPRPFASPIPLASLLDAHRRVLRFELSRLHGDLLAAPDLVGPRLVEEIRLGLALTDAEHRAALAEIIAARAAVWAAAPWPAIVLSPAAPGAAPVGTATGDPSLISPLTALGGPIAAIPCGTADGMPLGALLSAAPGRDGGLAALLAALGV